MSSSIQQISESKVNNESDKPIDTNVSNLDISRDMSSLNQSLLENQPKSFEELLNQRDKIFKDKQIEIKQRHKEMGINLDKIKLKDQVYGEVDNKGKLVKVSEERILKFLEGKLQIQKERSAKGERWIKIYKNELQETQKVKVSLQETIRVDRQNNDAICKKMQNEYASLHKQFQELSQNYTALSVQKQKQLQNQSSGSSIVPFIMTRIDDILKQRNKYIRLNEQDLYEFRSIKHDATGIVNKLVFLVQKLKEKQEDKDELEKEQKVQTQFHNDEKKRLRELVADYSKKYKKSEEVVEILKVQNRRCLRIMVEKQDKLDKLIKDRNSLKKKYEEYEKIEKIQGKDAAIKQAYRKRKTNNRLQMKHNLLFPRQIEQKLNRIVEEQDRIDMQNGVPMKKPTEKDLLLIKGLMQMGAFNNMDENGQFKQPSQEEKQRMFQMEKQRRKKEGIKLIKDPKTGKEHRIPIKIFGRKDKPKIVEHVTKNSKYFGQDQFLQREGKVRGSTSTQK